MKHLLLGTSGLRVSEIGLGTLNFGEQKDWGVTPDIAHAILSDFADHGGTLIDTAPNYAKGASEEIVGAFLSGRRDDFVVSTKYTASNRSHILAGGNSARTMISSVDSSLRRLGTDYIDVLWLHYWDGTTSLIEILKAAENLTAAGKIRYFGFSDTPAWLVSRACTIADLRGWNTPVAIQAQYNLAQRDIERELTPMADALGLGVVAWGPFAAGALLSNGASLRVKPNAMSDALRSVVTYLAEFAQRNDMQPAEAALRWLMCRSLHPRVVPLVGARTVDQLRQTLSAADNAMDTSLASELDRATAPSLGFPHELIKSSYLQRLAYGDPSVLIGAASARS